VNYEKKYFTMCISFNVTKAPDIRQRGCTVERRNLISYKVEQMILSSQLITAYDYRIFIILTNKFIINILSPKYIIFILEFERHAEKSL